MINDATFTNNPSPAVGPPYPVEHDLRSAGDIQQRLLPRSFHHHTYLEVSGVNRSCYSVGGDYYDVVELEDGRTAFVVADVAGKGMSAALLTAVLQGGLAGIALTPDPTRLLNQLNRYVCARSETNHYATAILGVFASDGSLEFTNAGHQGALLSRRGQVAEVFRSECFPIGMFPEAEFHTRSSRLESGDTLVLFSDGLTEARNLRGEEFGIDRLAEALMAHDDLPVEALSVAVLSEIAGFTGNAEQTDDMTLLVLRYQGDLAREGTEK